MSVAVRGRMAGPLTRYREGFVAAMRARGYTDLSLANQVRLAADFSRWLERKAVALEAVDETVVTRFVSKRRRSHTHFTSRRALTPLLEFVTLLQAGNDRSVIALWLGHESIETTQMYLDADLTAKEQALARTAPIRAPPGRYKPDDELLAFLSGL